MKLVRALQGEESKAKNRCYLFSPDLTWPLKSKGNSPLCGLGAHSVESTEHQVPFILLPCEGLEPDSQWSLHLPATLHFTDLLLIILKSRGWGWGVVNSPTLVTCLAKLLYNQVSEFRANRVLGVKCYSALLQLNILIALYSIVSIILMGGPGQMGTVHHVLERNGCSCLAIWGIYWLLT